MLLPFILVLSMAAGARAQTVSAPRIKRCIVKTINFEQGLLNNATSSVITDVFGLTWLSTQTGMQRYNGYVLDQITPVVGKDTIKIQSKVYFFNRPNGHILISYKNRVLEYSPFTNSFSIFAEVSSTDHFYYAVVPIIETGEGLWCLEAGKGLVLLNLQGQCIQTFPDVYPSFNPNSYFLKDNLDKNPVACNSRFIFLYVGPNEVRKIDTKTHHQQSIFVHAGDIQRMACDEQRLYVLSLTSLSFVRIASGSTVKQIALTDLTHAFVEFTAMEMAGENQLLVGLNGHLFELDTAMNEPKEFTTLEKKPIMQNGGIHVIYTDKFKRIWMLTNDDVKRVKNVTLPFEHLLYVNDKNNFIRCLYFDEDNKWLLAGCYNGGIQLYDTLGDPAWEAPLMTAKVKDILAIEKLSGNHYLVITYGKGWWLLDLLHKQLSPIQTAARLNPRFKPTQNCFSNNAQQIDDSTILVTTMTNAFRCIFRKNQLIGAEPLLPFDVDEGTHLQASLYTGNGVFWAGSYTGVIYRIDKSGLSLTTQIPNNYPVRSVTRDGLGHIWFGTEKGAYVYSAKGEMLHTVTIESGLLNDCIYAMLPVDRTAAIFASSNLGLSYIDLSGKITNYPKELGLQDNEFNTNACVKTSSGKLYFGGVNGITSFFPTALSAVKDSPIVNITRLVINDSLYTAYADPWQPQSLELTYEQKRLQFDIAAIGLLNTNEYVYSYRLRNFDDSWHTTHQPTGINYTLEPGRYTLEIKCSPVLSSGSVFTKNINIVIFPPWWQTWRFRLLAFFLLVSVIALIFWQYNQVRFDRKIRALKIQNEIQHERERISRELHDNIGTQLSYISSNVDWLLDAPVSFSREEETKRLSVVNETAKSLVTDLRQTIWAIKKEFILMDELADKLKYFLQSQCLLQSDMEMVISENIASNIIFSPTEALNIFRICQEAIVNAMKHAHARQISLNIESGAGRSFAFTVADNGQGYLQHRKYPGHYGLENMAHRAFELGAVLEVHSEPDQGTTVALIKR